MINMVYLLLNYILFFIFEVDKISVESLILTILKFVDNIDKYLIHLF